MNLICHFQLIFRKTLLILVIALAMSAVVFLITRNQPAIYTSSTVLYTGIASCKTEGPGKNRYLVSYNDRARFANLTNIIKSREVQEETGLRLLAQHLMQREADPRICLPETWRILMDQAPLEVKNLVATQESRQPDSSAVVKIQTAGKEPLIPLYYIVKAGDFPSAIAGKYNLTLGDLEQLNPGALNPIMGGQRLCVGYHRKPVAADSLDTLKIHVITISKDSTIENVSLFEQTVENLKKYRDEDPYNFIYRILRSDNPYYSIQKISSVGVKRIKDSGLIRLTYESDDPAVSMNTLMLITQAFIDRYKEIAADPPLDIYTKPTCRSATGQEIRIIDQPVIPSEPIPIRLLYLIGAFLTGILLVSAVILIVECREYSIKYPDRFSKMLGISLIGAFPKIPSRPDRRIDFDKIAERSIDHITQKIKLEEINQSKGSEMPFMLFLISTRGKEGKTVVGARIVKKLRKCGLKVFALKPLENGKLKPGNNTDSDPWKSWDFEYEIPVNFLNVKNVNELMRNYTFLTKGYQYIIIELPPLLTNEYPALLARSGNLSVVVGLASGKWKKADSEILKLYSSTVGHPVKALLNGCEAENLEPLLGDIPKIKARSARMT
jgi:capsular polysaccharide biosynthesis protein